MRIKGYKAVLHTNSSYYSSLSGSRWLAQKETHFTESDIEADFAEAYDYAKEQELKFYHSFFSDVHTYEEFIRKMRELFKKAEKDGERIRNLSNFNLSDYIPKQSNLPQYKYQIIITGKNLCEQIPLELLSSDNVSVKGGPIYLSVDLTNLSTIKEVVNRDLGKKRFNPSSSNMRNIKDWFNETIGETVEQEATEKLTENIVVSRTKINPNQKQILEDEIENGFLFSSDFGKGAKQKRQAILNGYYGDGYQKKFEQEMQEAISKIKNFIFNKCLQVNDGAIYNGVNVLKKAAEATWDEVIGNKSLDQQDFFFEGSNLYKSVLGKGGEFQASLIDKYVRMVLGQENEKIGQIIGNIVKDGRKEPRSDFQLMIDLGADIGNTILGIQVKNIGETSLQEVKINSDLGLIAPNLGVEFSDAITNSYFNTDIASQVGDIQNYLKEYLEAYFWKAMNLNIGPSLDPRHTNTFYWSGGTALVPASTIIQTIKSSPFKNPTFNISPASWPGMSDEEYVGGEDPAFLEYWYGSHDHWSPLFPNYQIYQQLLNDTTVHTSFSMARIFTANGGIANFEFLKG